MPVTETQDAFVVAAATGISLSHMVSLTAGAGSPTYLIVTGLDRNEYAVSSTGATGSLSGNGQTDAAAALTGDARSLGITFAWQAATGEYCNSTYGYLNNVVYTASSSPGDITDLSFFGTSSRFAATYDAANPYALMETDAAGYLGTVTVATEPGFTATVPAQATPDSLAAVARGFVGQAWNVNGCWTLASTIAAEAGAALPAQSTLIGLAGQGSGEWTVVFNGPTGQTGNWQSMVTTGDVIVIGDASGLAHVTTCVAGSGATAQLVDNIAYVGTGGQYVNAAGDGSASDVTIAAAHAAAQEWSGVLTSDVVIYRLDTPVVTTNQDTVSVAGGGTLALAGVFGATDPSGKAITDYQVCTTSAADSLLVNGVTTAAAGTANAASVRSLSAIDLLGGTAGGSDTLAVRAFNGLYWGDWATLAVSVTAGASTIPAPPTVTAAAPPTISDPTPPQSWTAGRPVAFALPAGSFADPQGAALTLTAGLAGGGALPGGLHFDAATQSFLGTAPVVPGSYAIAVTATDPAGLSATDLFTATVTAAAPRVTGPTPGQSWAAGQSVSFALPANSFTDPQGEALHYMATQADGAPLPAGLTFDGSTATFTGTAPITPEMLGLTVTATDASGLAASESVAVTITGSAPRLSYPTANQNWQGGTPVSFALPAGTFADPQGTALGFQAFQISGPSQLDWLQFDPATARFTGNVPQDVSGPIGIAVVATDALGLSAAETFAVTFRPAGRLNLTPTPSLPVAATEMLALQA